MITTTVVPEIPSDDGVLQELEMLLIISFSTDNWYSFVNLYA